MEVAKTMAKRTILTCYQAQKCPNMIKYYIWKHLSHPTWNICCSELWSCS